MKKQTGNSVDIMGICTSIICMIHCISIPLLTVFGLNSILWLVEHEWIEWTIIICSFILGSIAFVSGYLQHKQRFIPILFIVGFIMIVNGESVALEWLGLSIALLGATLIAYAHVQNLKWKRTHRVTYN